ncbi:MAG: hypothetical protein ABI193_00675 [Minicystis sp.]
MTSRQLVIDASVARSAGGEDATFPLSKQCRDFLQTTLVVCRRAVFTTLVYEEWKRHQSRFARKWRLAMVARKKISLIEVPEDTALRAQIDHVASDERARLAMSKDAHLIEAACATDFTVVSLDETVRRLFAKAAPGVRPLQPIIWANPDREVEGCSTWLRSGAPPDEHRRLDARRTEA